MESSEKPIGRPVLICTEHRGVFFGYAEDTTGVDIFLRNCRMAIRWGTTNGVQQLAATGPTDKSKVGSACDAEIRKVTAVFEVTSEAAEKWLAA